MASNGRMTLLRIDDRSTDLAYTLMNRRDFIRTTAAAGTAFSAFPILGRQARSYKTALIGSGWWGMNILQEALAHGRTNVVGLADVDRNQLMPAVVRVEEWTGTRPRGYEDYRELLASEQPEIVIVATPDHWHALNTIAAIESGAHVYVEKPIGHTLREGRAMVDAARKHERMVQVGTHRRISPHNISGMEFLKSGRAGKIGMVRAFVHSPSGSAGEPTPDAEPPEGLNWDFWVGPAPYVPYNPAIHPRGFRQYLNFANGTLGDWGIHWLDQVLWWTEEKFPRAVSSTGGRYVRTDGETAPDTQVVAFEFEDFLATWEHRRYAGNDAEHHSIGAYFYGTEGTFHMGWRDGWTFYPARRGGEVIHEEASLHTRDAHNIPELWGDFIQSIESNRLPVCDIEIGHRSTNMSLLGMVSHKLGRSIRWDGDSEIIPGDEEANELLWRPYRAPWVYPGTAAALED